MRSIMNNVWSWRFFLLQTYIYDDLKRPYLGLLSDSDVAKLLNYKSKMADNNIRSNWRP